MNYWLVKSEPDTFSLDHFRAEKVTVWYGVRNYTARNNLRAMQLGDICIFYRSVTKPAAVALAKAFTIFLSLLRGVFQSFLVLIMKNSGKPGISFPSEQLLPSMIQK